MTNTRRSTRRQKRSKQILVELEELTTTLQARNRNLTAADADALADRFTRELFEEMVNEGKITFTTSKTAV